MDSNGNETNSLGSSTRPSISGDGRYVAFDSFAINLVPSDTNNAFDVFVRDTCNGPNAPPGCTPSTTRASLAFDGSEANGSSFLGFPASTKRHISDDGRFVVFDSDATNLVPNDTNGLRDVFLRDTCTNAPAGCVPTTIRVSVAADGSEGISGNFAGARGSASADGRFVVFESDSSNLVPGDTNLVTDIFVRDTCLGPTAPAGCVPTTVRVSVDAMGTEANGSSGFAAISGDGKWVVFQSFATNLVAGAPAPSIYRARTGF